MKHDNRYTLTREYCGHNVPHWVARFCGEWIGSDRNRTDAAELIADHKAARQARLEGRERAA